MSLWGLRSGSSWATTACSMAARVFLLGYETATTLTCWRIHAKTAALLAGSKWSEPEVWQSSVVRVL
jgi:hypothetical protein